MRDSSSKDVAEDINVKGLVSFLAHASLLPKNLSAAHHSAHHTSDQQIRFTTSYIPLLQDTPTDIVHISYDSTARDAHIHSHNFRTDTSGSGYLPFEFALIYAVYCTATLLVQSCRSHQQHLQETFQQRACGMLCNLVES